MVQSEFLSALCAAGLLIDPVDGTALSGQAILVEDGVVTAVGSDVSIPQGTPIIDLSDRAVLPGVIDAHVHLTMRMPQGSGFGWVTNTPMARRAMVGVQQAREVLLAGFTIFADTPDEMVKAVRRNVHFGAQVIKIVIDDQEYLYSPADVRIIVEEAARSGRKVSAHVLLDQGARNAIAGGVASLEHAWGMSDDTLDLARESGVSIVTSDFTVSAMRAYGWPDAMIQTRRELVVDRMRRALARNVDIVFGSDLIWGSDEWDRGTWAMEQLSSFTEAGMTPAQILRSVTVNAARLLDVEDERGRIAEGYAADIIAVEGNPLEDISTLMNVSFVMKDRRVAKGGGPA